MSKEQLKAFLEKVKADTSLQEKLKAASDADAVVAIAKAAGFTITTEDLNSHRENLTEDELEGVAGGREACGLHIPIISTIVFSPIVRHHNLIDNLIDNPITLE